MGDPQLPGNMFVPIDAAEADPRRPGQDRPPRRTRAAVARRFRRRGAGPAGRHARVAGRARPIRPASRPATSSSASAATACARRPSSIARCGAAAPRAPTFRCACCRASTCSEVKVHSIDRVDYFRPKTTLLTRRRRRGARGSLTRRRRRPATPRTMRGCAAQRAAGAAAPSSLAMLLYAVTIFVSAFLLFLVQPIIAKQILPWFGGSAAVWTTCLVFFQTALLAGYAYCRSGRAPASRRARRCRLHIALLVAELAVLPIIPGAHWKPPGSENPSWLILGLLAATIGLPYFLLSTTSPLVQVWFARALPGRSPYRLFALSNLASMLALVGYPFLLEPWVADAHAGLRLVGRLRCCSSLLCAARAWYEPARAGAARADATAAGTRAARSAGRAAADARRGRCCGARSPRRARCCCSRCPITSRRTSPSVPLLWIVPLSIYLLTFILCFDGTRLVPARRSSSRCSRRRSASWRWTLADPQAHARARAADRRVLRRALPRLHVLPRRARAPASPRRAT